MLLKQTKKDIDDGDGVSLRYHLYGSLFNLRRLQTHTKTLEQLTRDISLADNAALVAHTGKSFAAHHQVGLKKYSISVHLRKSYCPLLTTIDMTELKAVHRFTYLGCTITSDAKIDKEVDKRLAKVSCGFGRLYKHMRYNRQLKKGTKFSMYRAIVLAYPTSCGSLVGTF